ncbi:MAG: preprotein translocase subunit SecY [Ruminococcaceae bacterium]|nr:preprotein translocase subunit SecY [Oscillospiraceae bacterium]
MLKTLQNAWKIPEIRNKLIFTLIIIVLYRIGCAIPVPFINAPALQNMFAVTADGSILQYMNIISGDALSKATLFALSISPYITASIVMQLLAIAIPALERLQKEGEEGRKKINQITRYLTVILGVITGIGYYIYLKSYDLLLLQTKSGLFEAIVIVACYSAGASLIMWLGEKVNENGVGNGISIILFANIVASLPASFSGIPMMMKDNALKGIIVGAVVIVIFVAIIAFVVFMTNSERRLPVQYAKKQVGRKMYGGQSTNLPLKLNMSGVMPIIFASSIVSIPTTILMFFPNKNAFWAGFERVFAYTGPLYSALLFILIIAFSYFYLAISFNPTEVANNLKRNGGFIPGIRPGKPTVDYITKSLNRITLIGAFFLGIIAIIPFILNAVFTAAGWGSLGAMAFGGTSLLIIVGVALETVREIEAQITMRHYKGFLG